MNYEKMRLKSFDSHWDCCVPTMDLAKQGFFLLDQTSQATQCTFCGLVLYRWECQDQVIKEHQKYRPKCPMVTHSKCNNVPLPKKIDPVSLDTCQIETSCVIKNLLKTTPKKLIFVMS